MRNETAKKNSQSILIGMGKKKTSDLDRATSYFKLKGKTITNQANQLNINVPNMKIKRKDGTIETKKVKPTNEVLSYYANKVKEQIVKKWKDATQEYYGTYNMFFKKYDSKSKKMKDVVVKITTREQRTAFLLMLLLNTTEDENAIKKIILKMIVMILLKMLSLLFQLQLVLVL